MKNFPVNVDGKQYWISRSIAVVGIVLKFCHNQWYVLANKRGKGCPDFQGYWNCTCGYLEYDRTCVQQIVAEYVEECGFITEESRWNFLGYNDSPSENKQNVTLRFYYFADNDEDFDLAKRKGGEIDEVEDVKWVPVNEVPNYQFAFGHQNLIHLVITNFTNWKPTWSI